MEQELGMWYNAYAAKAKRDKQAVTLEEDEERKLQTKRIALREAAAARTKEAETNEKDDKTEETRDP